MSKAKFFRIAEAEGCGVSYEKENGFVLLTVWAPEGKEFRSSSCACDASFNQITNASGTSIDWPRACEALLEVIADGFQDAETECI